MGCIYMSNVYKITDFNAPELDAYARLSERELHHAFLPDNGVFIAESPNVILRALDGGCVPISLLMEERHVEGQAKHIIERCGDIPVFVAELDVLTQLTGFKLTRGTLCAMYRPTRPTAESLLENSRRVVVIEEVMNPTNVGAIFRSAAALGIDAVLLTKGCSDPLYRRSVRVSMGTVFQIPWAYAGEGLECISLLKSRGFKTAAMALSDDSVPIYDEKLNAEARLAIVMGTEGEGLSPQIISRCDYTVRIPMYAGVDSLNVAAAAAVAFYQLGRRD